MNGIRSLSTVKCGVKTAMGEKAQAEIQTLCYVL